MLYEVITQLIGLIEIIPDITFQNCFFYFRLDGSDFVTGTYPKRFHDQIPIHRGLKVPNAVFFLDCNEFFLNQAEIS